MSRQQWDPLKEQQDGSFGYVVVIVPSSWGAKPITYGPFTTKHQARMVLDEERAKVQEQYSGLRVRAYWYKLGKVNS